MLSGNWTSGNITLFGRRRDQGRLPDQEFAELSDGWIKFSYWLYLENDKSGIDVYMGDYNQPDARLMTLRIDPENDGIIKCQANSGWYSTGLKIEPGRWRKFSIYCNLDERSCWYCIGDESVTILAADLPLPSTPLSVDTVYFKPTGIDSVNNEILGMKVFVDDVEVLWGNSFADFNNYLEGDINTDHYVDFQDFHLMISQWLLCTDPQRPECDVY
jgi:hypothetical protein